jgi:cell wall assembly regulator SMI1
MASAKKTTTKKATKPEPSYFICVGPLKEEITDPEVLAAAKEYIEAQQRAYAALKEKLNNGRLPEPALKRGREAEAEYGRAAYALRDLVGIEEYSGFDVVVRYPLLSLAEVVEQWGMWKRIVEEGTFDAIEPDCPPTVRKVWWNLKWVPFTHNGGGDHPCIDLDPAETGTVGQVVQFNHEVGAHSVLAPDLAAYLEHFAGDLEGGHYRFDPDELWLVAVPKKGKKQR